MRRGSSRKGRSTRSCRSSWSQASASSEPPGRGAASSIDARMDLAMSARTYWLVMWWLLGAGFTVMFAGAFASLVPLAMVGGILVLAGALALRMWMWQKAYEGAPNPPG